MVKFAHISNYSDLMGFTIFKCGSGYQKKIPISSQSVGWDFCFALRVRKLSACLQKSGNMRNFYGPLSLFQIGKPGEVFSQFRLLK